MSGEVLLDSKEAGEDLAGFAFDYVGEGGGIERGLGADVDGAGCSLAGPVNEVGCRVDGAGGADDQHESGFANLRLYTVHFEGNLTEEDNVGTETASAGATTYFGEAGVDGSVLYGRCTAIAVAVSLGEFAMHVEQTGGAGALVEIVDVLGAEKEAVA